MFRGYPEHLAEFLKAEFTEIDDTRYLINGNHSELVLQENGDNYEVWSLLDTNKTILLSAYVRNTVKGTHDWDHFGILSNRTFALNFNNCSDQEFSCDDGFCLDIEKRCNYIPNCADESDELHCDLIR